MIAKEGCAYCLDCQDYLDCDDVIDSPIFIKSLGSPSSSSSSSSSRREERVEAQKDRLAKEVSDAIDKFVDDMGKCKNITLETINQRIGNVVEAFAQLPVYNHFFHQNRNNVVFSSVTIALREKDKITRFMALGELDFLVIRPVKPVDLVSVKFDIYKVDPKTDRTFLGILLSLSEGLPLKKLREAMEGKTKSKLSEDTIVEIVGTNVLTGQDFIWSPALFRHTTCVFDLQKVVVYGIAPKPTIEKTNKKIPQNVIPLGLTKNELIDQVLQKVKNEKVANGLKEQQQ